MSKKIGEIKRLWDKFSKKEYQKNEPLILYAVDCGGYDITGEVQLEEREGKLFLVFSKYNNKRYRWDKTKEFELK